MILFHVSRWRERLVADLTKLRAGRAPSPPPDDVDRLNDRELAEGRAVGLSESTRRADQALGELIDLWKAVGERPLKWYIADTTGEAIIRNSYFHPRNHFAEHFIERGDRIRGEELFEQTVGELRKAAAPAHTLGPALYNLACVRVADGRLEEAIELLREGVPMRPDLLAAAAQDSDFSPLRHDPRFQALIGGTADV